MEPQEPKCNAGGLCWCLLTAEHDYAVNRLFSRESSYRTWDNGQDAAYLLLAFSSAESNSSFDKLKSHVPMSSEDCLPLTE